VIRELAISDFAIIERSTIRLEDGLVAITGETGAGKSILLDALGAVLGQRVGSDLVRTGARSARIEALFEVPAHLQPRIDAILGELGIESEGDQLFFAREVQASGRSTARVNGRMATAGALSELGSLLVDIHGQSDHLSLLKASAQRDMLDEFAELQPLRRSLQEAAAELRELRHRLRSLESGARDHIQRVELLRFQVEELDNAALHPNEDIELARQREMLLNVDRLRTSVGDAEQTLIGSDVEPDARGVLDLLRLLEHHLASVSEIDREATGFSERATELVVLAEDLSRDLRDYAETIEADPEALIAIEERLDLVRGLMRKYGPSLEQVFTFHEGAANELRALSGEAFDVEAVRHRTSAAERAYLQGAMELSKRRRLAAAELGPAVEQSAADLKLGRSQLRVDVRLRHDVHGLDIGDPDGPVAFDDSGIDEVEFLFAPNVGETLRPLGRIASGGETARLMLAMKSILSEVDHTPTMVFDEIDVGVGARSGQVVGEKLWRLSRSHQVIVITHLPQIAAYGDAHFRIVKSEEEGRTVSRVEEIDGGARIDELAYMIDGIPATEESRANALVILDRVNAVKQQYGGIAR
jgi:DNA repair protein RecN (Recombination protein N)